MIYTTDISNLIATIPSKNVQVYLEDLGWTRVKTKRDSIMGVYTSPSQLEKVRVTVPFDKGLSDYNFVMKELVECLSEVYKKDTRRIVTELQNPNADIIRFRVVSEETESGVIGFDKGIQLFNNAKKLLVYSAMDVSDYRQIHLGRPKKDITSLIDACRIGQTEIGSFLVSIICPFYDVINGELRQLSLLYDQGGFGQSKTRKATTKLMNSVNQIKNVASNNNIDELLDEKIGISVNFYESLVNVGISEKKTNVEISANWTPLTPNNDVKQSSVNISNDEEYEALYSAITHIKKHAPETKTVRGKIEKLIAKSNQRGDGGEITIKYIADDYKKKPLRVKLQPSLYDESIIAHKSNSDVEVVATLNKETNKWIGEELTILE
jgi:hypothetical protein